MIDFADIKITRDKISDDTLSNIIDNAATIIFNPKTGLKSYYCNHKGLKLYLSEKGLSIKGSPTKYYLGDNDRSLNINTTKLAFEKLSDELGICLDDCKITRLDIGFNIIVDKAPIEYFRMLGNNHYYNRLDMENGVEYRNDQRGIIFYDKQLEMANRGAKIIPTLHGLNILRNEIKIKNSKSICRNLNVDGITVKDLYNPFIYRKMLQLWGSEFDAIEKYNNPVQFSDEIYRKPKQFCNQITYKGIEAMGGYGKIREMIFAANKRGVFDSSEQYSTLKRRVRLLNNITDFNVRNELVLELETKVRDIVLIAA
jgi:hypothetical protein